MRSTLQVSKFKILHLSKENLKFSAAHFLIFDANHAERLHGHNYRVQVDFKIPYSSEESETASKGYGVDFGVLKKIVKGKVDQWDEYVLLPSLNKEMLIQANSDSLKVQFRNRRYEFPANEVQLLPVINISVELLSELLCQNIWKEVCVLGVEGLQVSVEETVGQSALSSIGNW